MNYSRISNFVNDVIGMVQQSPEYTTSINKFMLLRQHSMVGYMQPDHAPVSMEVDPFALTVRVFKLLVDYAHVWHHLYYQLSSNGSMHAESHLQAFNWTITFIQADDSLGLSIYAVGDDVENLEFYAKLSAVVIAQHYVAYRMNLKPGRQWVTFAAAQAAGEMEDLRLVTEEPKFEPALDFSEFFMGECAAILNQDLHIGIQSKYLINTLLPVITAAEALQVDHTATGIANAITSISQMPEGTLKTSCLNWMERQGKK